MGGGGVRIRKVGRNGGEGVIGVDGDATPSPEEVDTIVVYGLFVI